MQKRLPFIITPLLALLVVSIGFAQPHKSVIDASSRNFTMPSNLKESDYLSKTIVFKVKSAFRTICADDKIEDNNFRTLYTTIGGNGLHRMFPHSQRPEKETNEQGQAYADLTLIYEFTYTANLQFEKLIRKFALLSIAQYAEPHYVPHVFYTPNDPDLVQQYAITNIQAEAAWGVNTTTARGDTNVVIGITDTGTEPTHDDLKNQIKHNYLDTLDGIDNDGDGYIDNFSGWDLGENDNDPTYNANAHGVHVSGIAAAENDNATNGVGVGFNCKFLPVKIANASGTLSKAYEGITYAADHNCAIINCSWGGTAGGQLGQDVVTYATINKNALVVAAAGNDGMDEVFYPAAYTYVISVANTKNDDRRSVSSNFNYTVDVCAPGENIYSTYPTNSYASLTGTSMASPCAAGASAIIKSFYPSYSALQVGERLKVTCDNIYGLMSPIYANKLGNGRINLYRAITDPFTPSVVMTQKQTTDNNDNTFVIGDTLRIGGNFINYLNPTTNLIATLSTSSPFVTILNSSATLGAIATLGSATNYSNPFVVQIMPSAPQNTVVTFQLTLTDAATSYTKNEFFTETVNVDYVNITINDVATTINSSGHIGYSGNNQSGGLGFNYMNGGTLMYESGLMVGSNANQVSDAIRVYTTPDADFQSINAVHTVIPSVYSEFDLDGKFHDALATQPLPVDVHHKAFAWSTVGNRKFVIVQYVITNTGAAPLSDVYAGIFTDWDIDATTFTSNRASFDAANKMGYAYYTGANAKYAGVKLLTNTAPVVHYAIDNINGGGGGVDITATGFGYSGTLKYTTLSTNRTDAGLSGTGNDVCDVVSSGPFTMAVGDSIKVAFAIIAGDSLPDLQNSATNAQIKYDGMAIVGTHALEGNQSSVSVYPNPSTTSSSLDFMLAEAASVKVELVNILGEQVQSILSEKLNAGHHRITNDVSSLGNGIYFYQITIGNKHTTEKLIIAK